MVENNRAMIRHFSQSLVFHNWTTNSKQYALNTDSIIYQLYKSYTTHVTRACVLYFILLSDLIRNVTLMPLLSLQHFRSLFFFHFYGWGECVSILGCVSVLGTITYSLCIWSCYLPIKLHCMALCCVCVCVRYIVGCIQTAVQKKIFG